MAGFSTGLGLRLWDQELAYAWVPYGDLGDSQYISPGCTAKMLVALRRERVEIFRGYLRQLGIDFGRTCAALKLLMVQASCDRPDLASTLVCSQVAFAAGMAAVQVKLVLYSWGVGTVNVADLLKLFDGMRVELRTLIPAAMPVGA